jgi:oxygen-dependent protoporphyrinogen oxidase
VSSKKSLKIAIVGGGVSGLTAAYRLRQKLGDGADIAVIEAAPRLGGKLKTGSLADDPVDLGAEAFIARRPEVAGLLDELGLSDEIVHPGGTLGSALWANGKLQAIPARTLQGVPAGPDSVAHLVDQATLAKMAAEPQTPFEWVAGSDVALGALVADRFGMQVVRRSVDPMMGGVYSSLSDTTSLRAALPPLAAALDAGATSLTDAVNKVLGPVPNPAAPAAKPAPVFGALRGGYKGLIEALAVKSRARVVHAEATALTRTETGWNIAPAGDFDGVVITVPAPALGALLAPVAPDAAAAAAAINLASSAVVALALPTDEGVPHYTGVLVATDSPLGPGTTAKAFTLSSNKWPHLREREATIVRASYGRFGDAAIVDAPDDELIAAAIRDFAVVSGATVKPVDAVVQRWHGGLPNYQPGHLDRVAAIEHGVGKVDGVEVAGAMLRGVGVPACIASANAAADKLAATLS